MAISACNSVDVPPISTPTPTETATAAAEPTLSPVSTQVSPKDGTVQVCVPEGNFTMGTTDEQVTRLCVKLGGYPDCTSWYSNEKPQHTVWLDAYWIDRTEVTNAQYAKCVADGVCQKPYERKPKSSEIYYGNVQYANYPVTYLDWTMAATYCKWAGRRLPTEAEWEKAARGTDGRTYPWGDDAPTCRLANYYDGKNYCVGYTSAVGSYPDGASRYGALDMAGNVWEWVTDWYGESYYGSSPLRNPLGPESGEYRVLRGGTWDFFVWGLRSAYRYWGDPVDNGYNYGVRCAASS